MRRPGRGYAARMPARGRIGERGGRGDRGQGASSRAVRAAPARGCTMPRLRGRLSDSESEDDIAERIARGEYEPGSGLPSYAQLADIYDVSFSTAARAVRVLRERGLIYGEPGRGLYV